MESAAMGKDYSPNGHIRLEGQWENDRNANKRGLLTAILREVFGNEVQTIIAHHICYQVQDRDTFLVEEIPSIDALIFDHTIAQKIFGAAYLDVLAALARVPADARDDVFESFYRNRDIYSQEG